MDLDSGHLNFFDNVDYILRYWEQMIRPIVYRYVCYIFNFILRFKKLRRTGLNFVAPERIVRLTSHKWTTKAKQITWPGFSDCRSLPGLVSTKSLRQNDEQAFWCPARSYFSTSRLKSANIVIVQKRWQKTKAVSYWQILSLKCVMF